MSGWELVGGNPAPGDPVQVRAVATTFGNVSSDAEEAHRQLVRIRDDWHNAIWKGHAADAFRASIEELPGDLKKLFTSYDLASGGVRRYASDLGSAQDQAKQALQKAQTAEGDRTRADADKRNAGSTVSQAKSTHSTLSGQFQSKNKLYELRRLAQLSTGQPDPGLQALYNELVTLGASVDRAAESLRQAKSTEVSAQKRSDDANSDIRAATRLAGQARDLRETAANRAKQALDEASDAGIHNKSWRERATAFVGKLITFDPKAWDSVLEALKTVANVLTVASLLLSWVPVLGEVLAVAALVVSVAILAITVVKAANGKASWWDVGIAVLDTGLAVVGARGAGKGIGEGIAAYADDGLKVTLKTAGKKAAKEAAEKAASKMRPYTRLMKVMKNPSAGGFKTVLVGFSKNAGAAKRILNYKDARRAAGLLHSAYAMDKAEVPFYLLHKGKDIIEFGRDVDQYGLGYGSKNAFYHSNESILNNIDPKGYTKKFVPPKILDRVLLKPDIPKTLKLPGRAPITIPTKVSP